MTPEWFEEHRGIAKDTLDAFGIRFAENEVIFPYPTLEKTRYFGLDGQRRFKYPKGSKLSLFTPPSGEHTPKTAFLCEGETDTMRLWQAFDKKVATYGLGGIETWQDSFVPILDRYEKVYVILDNDQDYNVQAQVDRSWRKIRQAIGHKARRVYLPQGAKDVCEFFELGYDVDDLKLIIKEERSVSRFSPLDLTRTPPPVNWLLEGLIAMGDVALFSGASGLGKSQLTMGLAVAVAEGYEEFIGRELQKHGRVLYIDEENPEDVVFSRLKRFGLKSYGNLRYIWNNGVRLDHRPGDLIDEAIEYEPTLIVIDSLTRVHSQEENSVGQMSPLLNNVIKPLARDTGAAVVLIHHHDKSGSGPRGSSDLVASPDSRLDAFDAGKSGSFVLKLSKSRRRLDGEEIIVDIQDTPEGGLHLHAHNDPVLPF